ncbi:GMC family oxidoreductase [Lapillicoccus sp.]|uniref:GMC oxidoreductase n=1 Tax=Lapillicoccus sp. TaxID=1909287 RepID=UPI0025FCB925|nr:GMC family oxidoreductase [Lapillicoccus sp.]
MTTATTATTVGGTRHTGSPERLDHDVIVIGTGFGGSVSALRLAEKGYRVHMIESGRRFEDADFAATSWDLRRYLWAPRLGCFGVQRVHKLPDVMILAGAGVGGGSLNYANTLYVPPEPFFRDPQWGHITDWQAELAPHYVEASRMLGVVVNPVDGPVEQLMRRTADDLGVGHTFRKTPVGVFFGPPGERVADPYFGGDGPERTGCTLCGNCMVGCRDGAKNTLRKNYLWFAERLGVGIEAMRTVVDVRPRDEQDPTAGYAVTTERTGAWVRKDRRTVTSGQVVLAAGAWGTQKLLHAMRTGARGRPAGLPGISTRLGELTRTNSEALGGTLVERVPKDVDLTKGVAITTSFNIDDTTHVENCRYGKGSNAMGLLATMMVDGGGRVPRPLRWVGEVVRHPVVAARSASNRHWSERTVIALIMQTRDNSITVSGRRGLFGGPSLTSRQGHGEPNPTWIPEGARAIRAIAIQLAKTTGLRAFPGSSLGEIADIPLTAHFLGGAVISDTPEGGVVDPYHRVWGYPGLHIVDGSAVSANLGVNPALTITAQAERAMSLWPAKGEPDRRPEQGEAYVRLDPAAAPTVVAVAG